MNHSKREGMSVLRFIDILQDISLHSLLKTYRDTFRQKNVAPIPYVEDKCGRHLAVEIHPLTPASGGHIRATHSDLFEGKGWLYTLSSSMKEHVIASDSKAVAKKSLTTKSTKSYTKDTKKNLQKKEVFTR